MLKKALVLGTLALGLAACGSTREDRALTGGLIGAGAGAAIGGAASNSVGGAVAGGVIGGAAGAIIGAETAPRWCRGVDRYGRSYRYRC